MVLQMALNLRIPPCKAFLDTNRDASKRGRLGIKLVKDLVSAILEPSAIAWVDSGGKRLSFQCYEMGRQFVNSSTERISFVTGRT